MSPGGEGAVRAARPEDAEAIGRVHIETWRVAYRGHLPDAYLDALDVAARIEGHRGRLLAPPSPDWRAWVAEAEGAVRGFAVAGPTRDEDAPADTAEVYAIYVHPAWAGRGLGRALLRRALDSCRDRRFRRATLWVLESNRAARLFYERAGFALDASAPAKWLRGEGWERAEVRYARDLMGGGAC